MWKTKISENLTNLKDNNIKEEAEKAAQKKKKRQHKRKDVIRFIYTILIFQ